MSAEDLVPVSEPSIVATTSLPKRDLSYRWVIHDAKVFLEQDSRGLRSPTFCVTLPLKTDTDSKYTSQTSSWHLHVERKGQTVYTETYKSEFRYYLHISLWFGSGNIASQNDSSSVAQSQSHNDSDSKVLISKCVFSIVNPERNTAYHVSLRFHNQCIINRSRRESVFTFNVCEYADIDKYLCNGTLTIQVNATLLCFTDPFETLEEEHKMSIDIPRSMFEGKLFSDAIIKCGDEEFQAHKAVLASQSPVFKRMFETDMTEKRSSVIEISDTDPKVISEMLSFLYTGSAPNTDAMAVDLLIAADKYELSQLSLVCERKLKSRVTVSNVVELLILADLHNAEHLKKACLNYIYHHSVEVYCTSQWKQLKLNCEGQIPLLMEVMEFTPQ